MLDKDYLITHNSQFFLWKLSEFNSRVCRSHLVFSIILAHIIHAQWVLIKNFKTHVIRQLLNLSLTGSQLFFEMPFLQYESQDLFVNSGECSCSDWLSCSKLLTWIWIPNGACIFEVWFNYSIKQHSQSR